MLDENPFGYAPKTEDYDKAVDGIKNESSKAKKLREE